MKKEVKKQFCKALRSGKYKQMRMAMYNGNHFCATGVLCDISKISQWKKDSDDNELYFYDGCWTGPSNNVREWAGLTYNETNQILNQNDENRKTFEEIADWVEENL